MQYKINIEICSLNVDNSYYSFKYKLSINNKEIISDGYYESDHDWCDDIQGFKKRLKEGAALSLVFEQISDLDLLFEE